ncbi:RnfABCDGE type electron transport complex subunit D [Candidatus Riflebacteria bacterium]
MTEESRLALSTSPFLHHEEDTPWIMYRVILALIAPLLAAFYFFGLSALLVTAVAIFSCLLTEWFFDHTEKRGESLKDGSAIITGILLALTLPPGIALWMVFLGGVVAIGMGKVMWGGLGNNVFNPALLGRAFLQAAFPAAITTWQPPDGRFFMCRGSNLALPFMQGSPVDGVTTATPLSLMKFQHEPTGFLDLLLGNTGGSLGETSGLLLILAGIYLWRKNVIEWRIPVGILSTVALFSGVLYIINPKHYPSPAFMLFSGGILLGAIFMATDMVTCPITSKGCWIFGFGIGFLIVLIRVWGGLPEGVMYAILLMNSVTPLINRISQQRVYGTNLK